MSNKKEASLEVAIRGGGIADIIKALDAKMKEYEYIKDSKWKTSGNLDGFTSIKDETLVTNLIRAYSVVKGRAVAYNDAAEDLGLKSYPVFDINGSSVEDWKNDILLRKAIIEQKETMDKLEAFKEKASKFMTEAEQKKIFMEEMANFVSTFNTGQ